MKLSQDKIQYRLKHVWILLILGKKKSNFVLCFNLHVESAFYGDSK